MRELREVFILDDKVMKVVSEVVCTCSTSMAIEDTKEAYLGPLRCYVGFALGLENVEDYGDPVLIIVPNNALVRIGSVRLDHATLFLRCLRRLVIFQEKCFRVQNGRVLSEEQCLDLDELDIAILRVLAGEARGVAGVAGGTRMRVTAVCVLCVN